MGKRKVKKTWQILHKILSIIFKIITSILLVVIVVGLSPIIALFLVMSWLYDNWGILGMADLLKIGANHEKESEKYE